MSPTTQWTMTAISGVPKDIRQQGDVVKEEDVAGEGQYQEAHHPEQVGPAFGQREPGDFRRRFVEVGHLRPLAGVVQHQAEDQQQHDDADIRGQIELMELVQVKGPGLAAEEVARTDGEGLAVRRSEHIGDDLPLEHVGLGGMAVAAAVGPQGQAGRSDVVVDIEAFHVAGPGVVLLRHHFTLVIEVSRFMPPL